MANLNRIWQTIRQSWRGQLPILESERLRLRPPLHTDLRNIHLLGSDPEVMRYIRDGQTQNLEQAREDLQLRIEQSNTQFGYWITETKEGEFIGWMALKPLEYTSYVEIGYRYMQEQWGRGYATEASFRLLQYAFSRLNLPEVVAVALEENRASTRVMEKVGMTYQGRIHAYNKDCVLYSVLKKEFKARKLSLKK